MPQIRGQELDDHSVETSGGISLLQAEAFENPGNVTSIEQGNAAGDQSLRQDRGQAAQPESRVHVYMRQDESGAPRPIDSYLPKNETVQDSASVPTKVQRNVLTASLLGISLIVSCFLRNVLVVWSIMGSTAAFLISFILPAVYWYQIVGPFASSCRRRLVGLLIWLSIVLAVSCTVQTIMKLGSSPCPAIAH